MEFLQTLNTRVIEAVEALNAISFSVGHASVTLYTVLKAVTIIVLLLWLTGHTVRKVDNRLAKVSNMRASNRALIVKMCQIGLYTLVIIIAMQVLGISLTALSVFGGALGVGIGFGLQKIASNFISGIILLFEKSIEIGDLIELSDGTTGVVRQLHARYTLIETPEGKEIFIPNEDFISQRVISWTHTDTYARAMISVTIAHDSDFTRAKKLMVAAADAHPKRIKTRPSLAVLHEITERGVEMQLQFWVANIIDGRREPRSDVMQAMLQAFHENGIHVSTPQREVRVVQGTPIGASA